MRRIFDKAALVTSAGLLACALGGSGCNKAEASPVAPAASAAAPRKADAHAKEGHSKEGHGKSVKTTSAAKASADRRFMVPFSWEAKKDDPLARTRSFMRDAFDDNGAYVKAHGPEFFEKLREAQHPRATLVTCSDSRVQTNVLDRAPEDDVFTIRNIGNQLATAQGSVEYGVRHLKTSVLVVLGHTRCGAVKAAMGDFSGESEALVHELESLRVPKAKDAKEGPDNSAWLAAVKANVNDQVSRAVSQFGDEVEQGNLTVVGAIYDLADDLHEGAGVVHVVNVNGNTDAPRITAFSRAVRGLPPLEDAEASEEKEKAPAKGRTAAKRDEDLTVKQLAALRSLQLPSRDEHADHTPKPADHAPAHAEHH